ncbi:adenylate/guanylate cyclase domain-containing protein [Aurantibacter crassamenti]|uniref:adenylate/guanylate cyclase domain-containing protein n=1 Tax=Aurantibacter crassamenti TaxID=1837375 RepID=UPI00193A05B2|nr:adenylate/guanylate cyclase domain-containing protein [Aurantibacter crassamenti]MBM1106549.1 adenylate/guanylate cyclase domain-containing protein [Aurantibacter crassamenti]
MILTANTKRNILRVIPFGIIWLVFGALFLWIEYAALDNQKNIADTAIQMKTDVVVFALIGITFVGFLVGFIELIYLNRLFEKQSFLVKIISKFLIYSLFFVVVILITFPIAASLELNTSIFDNRVWNRYGAFFFSITNASTIIQLSFSLLVSLLYAEISENIGQNVLLNFFTGKYHKPVTENRIFMFADMKSSTTIAEELGHIKYFELLRSYYFDLSNAIVKNQGEVYQYIGDEIVISWKLKNGLKNNQCLHCFYDMKSDLKALKNKYLKKFGVFPDFKAALHFGEVTTGEIGALKKEIFFTGDVLNTTARIQGLCQDYGVDLLLSKTLMDRLYLNDTFTVEPMGKPQLKGKIDSLELVTTTFNRT